MRDQGLFSEVGQEVGQVIVAGVDHARVHALLDPGKEALGKLIRKEN
jgi:isocitrate lyase